MTAKTYPDCKWCMEAGRKQHKKRSRLTGDLWCHNCNKLICDKYELYKYW